MIITLIVAGISIIVHIAVCYQCVYKPRQRASRTVTHKDDTDRGGEAVYEIVDNMGVAATSGSTIAMEQNEAYWHMQVKLNSRDH